MRSGFGPTSFSLLGPFFVCLPETLVGLRSSSLVLRSYSMIRPSGVSQVMQGVGVGGDLNFWSFASHVDRGRALGCLVLCLAFHVWLLTTGRARVARVLTGLSDGSRGFQ